jgi:ribosomal protein L16 Arg81 hydroxylase
MNIKNCTIIFLTILTIVSCQKKSESVYQELLNSELNDSKTFLNENTNQIILAIESKVIDFPYLKTSFDSLMTTNTRIDYAISHSSNIKNNKEFLNKLKSDLETNYKQSFSFKSLSLEKEFDEKLYLKIVEIDLLKAKYKINEIYCRKNCNKVH